MAGQRGLSCGGGLALMLFAWAPWLAPPAEGLMAVGKYPAASCSDSAPDRPTLSVTLDAGQLGSAVDLKLWLPPNASALPDGWRLCFTWLKAGVLSLPPGATTTGTYVELAPQPALAPGSSRTLVVNIGWSPMEHASDLPQNPHLVLPSVRPGGVEEVLNVCLMPPKEGDIRFRSSPPGPPGLVPLPLQVLQKGDQFDEGGFQIAGPVSVEALAPAAQQAAGLLKEWARNWPPGEPLAAGVKDGGLVRKLVLQQASDPEEREWLGAEGYKVTVSPEKVLVIAASVDGFHRGAATVRQLLGVARSEGRHKVPAVVIKDRPRFGYRGLMLDTARHFFPVSFIKQLFDWMYLYKLNVFHWHLTDDEGWRLEVKALPNLTACGAFRGRRLAIPPQLGSGPGRYGGFYSHEDVRALVQHAAERGITIVPEIDVPSHSFAAIRCLPELLGPAVRKPNDGPRSGQNFLGAVLDPGSPNTYVFLEKVLSEVLDLFPAPLGVHVGMDEVPNRVWSDDKDEEVALKEELLGWLGNFLADRGRTLLAWEEAFYSTKGTTNTAPPRSTAVVWKETEATAVQLASAGVDIVAGSAPFLYLDIVQGEEFEERGLYWAAPAVTVETVYSYDPVQRLRSLGLRPEDEPRLRGIQASLWSETVPTTERAEEMLFPRLLADAEVAWSDPRNRSWPSLRRRLAPQLQWLARDHGLRHDGRASGLVARGELLQTVEVPATG